MLRLAFFISAVCHLAVLLSIRNLSLLLPPATDQVSQARSISAQLISRTDRSAWVPPAARMPSPSLRNEATPSGVLARPGVDARHPVSGVFSPSTANDDIAVTEKTSTRTGDVAATPGAPQVPNEEASPDGVRQYRLNLAREARRFKHFPPLARERRWEGVAVVVVSTVAGVPLPQVSLSQSSGFDLLDQEALMLVAQAVTTAVLPDSLRNRTFALTLPIHYRLDD
jgi:protein TonB